MSLTASELGQYYSVGPSSAALHKWGRTFPTFSAAAIPSFASPAMKMSGMNYRQMISTVTGGTVTAPTGPPVNMSAVAGAVGAGIFAILGYLSAKKQNAAIAKAAHISMQRVNLYVTNMRVNAFLTIAQIANDVTKALGDAYNALPLFSGMTSRGISKMESLNSNIVTVAAQRDWNTYEGLRRQELNARHEIASIAARASAGQVNPYLEMARAGGEGWAIGSEAYNAVQNTENARRINQVRGRGFQSNIRGLIAELERSGIKYDNQDQLHAITMGIAGIRTEVERQQGGINNLRTWLEFQRGQSFRIPANASILSIGSRLGTFSPSSQVPVWFDPGQQAGP